MQMPAANEHEHAAKQTYVPQYPESPRTQVAAASEMPLARDMLDPSISAYPSPIAPVAFGNHSATMVPDDTQGESAKQSATTVPDDTQGESAKQSAIMVPDYTQGESANQAYPSQTAPVAFGNNTFTGSIVAGSESHGPGPYTNDYVMYAEEIVRAPDHSQHLTVPSPEQHVPMPALPEATGISTSDGQDAAEASAEQPVTAQKTDGKVTCPTCQQLFAHKTSLNNHIKALHEKKVTWTCEFPGCGRNSMPFNWYFSYRRHMREIHTITVAGNATWKVGDPNEPVTTSSTSTATATTSTSTSATTTLTPPAMTSTKTKTAKPAHDNMTADPMEAYLKGVGNKLPSDVRKRNRASYESGNDADLTNDTTLLKDEIKRLRARESQLLEELRVERARASSELQEAEKKMRAELEDVYQAYQEELRAARNNEAFGRQQDALKAQRDCLRGKHEKEIEGVHRKHQLTERKLWNLLKEGK
ncbi:hypothetical protein CONLIGDRAFT_719601 [Coniochaeta ligniaria NRRL 30616]|uniref:C2H2-type domain-containing protein n=1 Tax=Coniochaeta ligniaria NRRL 30616 TaxID=1408157 RepID=A0A1J7J5F9_9PEZI|nr:hypothetical protein CONLIGDRAFT_719601 [Coniochaeta ligniaria NRRL 30616]